MACSEIKLCNAPKMSSTIVPSRETPATGRTVYGWLEGRVACMGPCLVAPSNEVIHADGKVLGLLEAGAPSAVDHLQLQDLISARTSSSCTPTTHLEWRSIQDSASAWVGGHGMRGSSLALDVVWIVFVREAAVRPALLGCSASPCYCCGRCCRRASRQRMAGPLAALLRRLCCCSTRPPPHSSACAGEQQAAPGCQKHPWQVECSV